jgi:hypothetical protein
VVTEVALALTLLIGSALLGRWLPKDRCNVNGPLDPVRRGALNGLCSCSILTAGARQGYPRAIVALLLLSCFGTTVLAQLPEETGARITHVLALQFPEWSMEGGGQSFRQSPGGDLTGHWTYGSRRLTIARHDQRGVRRPASPPSPGDDSRAHPQHQRDGPPLRVVRAEDVQELVERRGIARTATRVIPA